MEFPAEIVNVIESKRTRDLFDRIPRLDQEPTAFLQKNLVAIFAEGRVPRSAIPAAAQT